MITDKNIIAVIAHYHQRIIDEAALAATLTEEQRQASLNDFLLPIGEETASFLYNLIVAAKAKTIVEIGTSYGYSTIWLAAAAKAGGGKLITIELDANKVNYAKQQIEKAGLSSVVDFNTGDALQVLKSINEKVDVVLIDIWKDLYSPCFEIIYPKLNKGAWVIADNMLQPTYANEDAAMYRENVKQTQAFDTVLLPIGSGIAVSCLK